jgi:hypothetical protein
MARFILTAVMAAGLATILSGCMTTAFAPTSADVQAYAIKSVSISGVAPQAVSEAVSSDISSAIRSVTPKAGSTPAQMSVAISGFSGSRVANGYKTGADVTVTLKPVAGGKVVQTASFHEDAVSIDEARASSQLANGIAARVRRNFNLPVSQAATASNAPRAAAQTKKTASAKPTPAEKPYEDAALCALPPGRMRRRIRRKRAACRGRRFPCRMPPARASRFPRARRARCSRVISACANSEGRALDQPSRSACHFK